MSQDQAQLQALLRPLREEQHTLDEERVEAIWADLAAQRGAALQRRPQRLALAALAASLLGLGLWALNLNEAPTIAPAAPIVALAEPGAEIQTGAALAGGAHVEVNGLVKVVENAEGQVHLRLKSGSVYSRVPPLGEGGAYVVSTPNALVRVHGTRFTVNHREGHTRVSVEEGRVEVQPKGRDRGPSVFLTAGEEAVVYPTSEWGLESAVDAGDWAQAITVALALADAPDALAACNAHLKVGRQLHDQAPALEMVPFWRAARQRFPSCVHAEEFGFRAAAALKAAGDLEGARQEATRFRRDFPRSLRAEETKGW